MGMSLINKYCDLAYFVPEYQIAECTHLHLALYLKNASMCQLLIDKGANKNLNPTGIFWRPLWGAPAIDELIKKNKQFSEEVHSWWARISDNQNDLTPKG